MIAKDRLRRVDRGGGHSFAPCDPSGEVEPMRASAKRPRLRRIDVRVPVLARRGFDWKSPRLDATDRAILRRVDGEATASSIASALGIAAERMTRGLAKLEGLGLVAYLEPRPSAPPSSPPVRLQSGMRPAARTLPAISPPMTEAEAADDEPRAAPPEGREPAMGPAVDPRARISALHGRLATLDHYELLGVPVGAHPMDVTLGYLALAATLQGSAPGEADGGAHRAEVDAILTQATLAHETLTSAERRAEYDALLAGSAASETPPRVTWPGIGPGRA